MTAQDSTIRQIVVGIVSSILAVIVCQLANSGLAHLRSDRLRRAVFQFTENIATKRFVRELSTRQLRTIAYGLIMTVTSVLFLSHSPTIAPGTMTLDKVVEEIQSDTRMADVSVRIPMTPCVIDNFPCTSKKSRNRAILLKSSDF
jgi:hypothetical protein